MSNGSFAFLRAYMDDVDEMPEALQLQFLKAIIAYGLDGEEPEFDDYGLRIAFKHARRMIDAGNSKKELMKENGNKGGRPKTKENQSETKNNLNPDLVSVGYENKTKENLNANLVSFGFENETKENQSETKKEKENKKENKIENISLSPTSPSQRIIAGGKARERERDKSDFDLFWDAYPRKDGLNAASDAWISAVEAGDIKYGDGAMIAEAVERAKTSRQWTQDGGRYIPMPARYIAERRWTDQGTTLPDTAGESSFDTSAFFAAALAASAAQMKTLAGGDG